MATRPVRQQPDTYRARVERAERLTPGMVRVVFGGPGLKGFAAGEFTDHYVKLLFPHPGVEYPEPFSIGRIREELPRDQWPVTRTYTVRRWDPVTAELTIDFVVHGNSGLAGPWAASAQPGDEIYLLGPGGLYRPGPDADWHLLAGDESALPAIAAALEQMQPGVPVHAFVEIAGPEEAQTLSMPEGVEVVWLHRGSARVGERLVAAVESLDFPPGRMQAFVHGEAGTVKTLRRHLRLDRGIDREQLSISGYWRLGHDEDGWQSSKREWNKQVEAEQEGQKPVSAAAAG